MSDLIKPATENTELPKYDFNEGELKDQVEALKAQLGIGSGEPDGGDVKKEEGRPEGPITGAGIDWSEFDLNPNVAHLYPESRVVDTPQGPKWVVNIDEFMTREKNVNPPAGEIHRNEKTREALDMSNFVNESLVAAPEPGCTPWKLVAFMPGSMTGMAQVVFQRKKLVGLPDPMLLEKEEDAAAAPPVDEELAAIEKNAANWAGDEPPTEPYTSGAVEGADSVSE